MPNAVNLALSSFGFSAKEFGVGRVGAGIAALDIVDAELIQHLRDDLLVVQREIDAVGLRAVAQRGVEEIKAFAAHDGTPGAGTGQRLLHRGVGEPFAVDGDGVALHGDIAALPEERLRGIAGIDRQDACPRAPASFSSASTSIEAHAPARSARMDVEHVDMVGAF
jgi:hypothetical protein